ncbi:SDR family NAD(P)-dependent oxidoreductase [Rhodovulum strictum]|uniref:SDR family NAD(P)-dependent oxidoreductase n=1 Tax=Rhodovulum strictum TaxID=58314 RepID=A0A844BKS1_9RHOB|nr:SDR family NAD(P)-dependent oxidoreductase [Rhodovulum strictum]MRH21612.1 SDR family NAD(P)-dependent oxidoreductase [Rhodovulum strictum]
MSDWAGRRYWIVGASEGLGRALAEQLSALGVELVLSARTAGRLDALAASLPARAQVVTMDVSDSQSVRDAFAQVGDIDGMVFLAGVYWPQPAQAWNADEVEAMCDINFTGAARVLGQVVPHFVARGRGHIVLTGSLSGFRGLPGAIGYCASKAGLMSLAESMYADLRGSGIKVQLVNPGFIRTRLTDKNDFAMPFIMDPDPAARIMVEHMMTDRFSRSFPTLFSWLFRLSQFLPEGLYYRIFAPRR